MSALPLASEAVAFLQSAAGAGTTKQLSGTDTERQGQFSHQDKLKAGLCATIVGSIFLCKDHTGTQMSPILPPMQGSAQRASGDPPALNPPEPAVNVLAT